MKPTGVALASRRDNLRHPVGLADRARKRAGEVLWHALAIAQQNTHICLRRHAALCRRLAIPVEGRAMIGGFVVPMLGFGGSNINNNDFSLSGLLVAFVGAVILLAIYNLATRGRVR